MVEHYVVSRTVQIPDNVEVKVEGNVVGVKGNLGELSREFRVPKITIEKVDKSVSINAANARKAGVAAVGSIASHIENMFKGVTKGFTYRMKIAYAHFPMTVKVAGDRIVIENFQGEKTPRRARISGKVNVTVEEDDVVIKGMNLESVAQTAANIEQRTRIRAKDSRVFLDGIYIYSKEQGM